MSSRSLLVLPDDSAKPILDAIGMAKRSLRVKMFVFSSPALLRAVVAARRRGVKVRVMLNPARKSGEEDNEETRKKLQDAGVDVTDASPAFSLTHEKSMVVDDHTAFVKSLNWATKNLTETRDYAVATSHGREVREVIDCFEADWSRKSFRSDAEGHIERMVRAARRGVKLHVMARPPHTLKKDKLVEGVGGLRIMDDVGIKIHKLKHLRLHGKMLLADGVAAIVGSMNLTPGSFDDRRELGIEVRDDGVVERLHEVAHHDWKHSHPLDLSDDGLLSDLESRAEAAAMLGLPDTRGGRKRKRGGSSARRR